MRPWIGVAIGLVLVLSALALALHPGYRSPDSLGVVPAADPGAGDGQQTEGGGSGAAPPSAAGTPRRLEISGIDIHAPVVPVKVSARQLVVPQDGAYVGWWSDGARAGARSGTVVLAGHVDTKEQGRGALYRLEKATTGDRVVVSTETGDVAYRVVALRAYHKSALPQDLFSPGGSPRLAVITCGGTFDHGTGRYESNVVVYGVPEA